MGGWTTIAEGHHLVQLARSYFFWKSTCRGTPWNIANSLAVVGRQRFVFATLTPLSLSSTWSSQIFQHVLLSKMVSVSRLYLCVLVHHGSEPSQAHNKGNPMRIPRTSHVNPMKILWTLFEMPMEISWKSMKILQQTDNPMTMLLRTLGKCYENPRKMLWKSLQNWSPRSPPRASGGMLLCSMASCSRCCTTCNGAQAKLTININKYRCNNRC